MEEYVPFGPQWEEEMMKWNKRMLIDRIRKQAQRLLASAEEKQLAELSKSDKPKKTKKK